MNSSIHVTRYIRTSLIFIAVFLLLVNIAGFFYHPFYYTPLSIYNGGIPGYDHPVSGKTGLLKMLQEKGDTNNNSFVDTATRKVFYSMFHSEDRRIEFYQNWIMWLAGKFYQPAGRT